MNEVTIIQSMFPLKAILYYSMYGYNLSDTHKNHNTWLMVYMLNIPTVNHYTHYVTALRYVITSINISHLYVLKRVIVSFNIVRTGIFCHHLSKNTNFASVHKFNFHIKNSSHILVASQQDWLPQSQPIKGSINSTARQPAGCIKMPVGKYIWQCIMLNSLNSIMNNQNLTVVGKYQFVDTPHHALAGLI